MLADEACTDAYPVEYEGRAPMILSGRAIIRGVVSDLIAGVPSAVIAAKFHNTIAAAITEICRSTGDERGLREVALGGGVFQNARLLAAATASLHAAGFDVYVPEQLPANDGGIALGQAAVANARIIAGSVDVPVATGTR
jgi:hydrogenase maturation protein HypF